MRIPTAMEDSSVSHQNGQLGQQGGPVVNNKQTEDSNQSLQYSIPGILHFIQHEWARFELERSQWDVDRAELQARIAFLKGERKGQENLKNDLVRRIKMLEYALKQERGKFHKLKYGVELPQDKGVVAEECVNDVAPDSEAPFSSVSNTTWRQGRQLLRQYLQEIGYTDTIIDVRSNRVRSLLGLNNNGEQEENVNPNINGNENNKRASESQGRRAPAKKPQPGSMTEALISDSEAAVMANFEFLAQADVDLSDEDEMLDDLDLFGNDSVAGHDSQTTRRKTKSIKNDDDVDAETDEVLNEFNAEIEDESGDIRSQGDAPDWSQAVGFQSAGVPRRTLTTMGAEDETIDSSLGLGELAQLTVNNDAETTYDVASTKDSFRKTWNAKYTLRSHFDGVRALAFHPTDSVLITASEDHTLKLWNLQKTVPAKKSASLDVEPLYTFRLHNGPVLCLAMSANGEQCYTGGLDGAINAWNVPNINIDPYDSYEPDVLGVSLEGHSDAVWGLSYLNLKSQLLSCSADGTVKLWCPSVKAPLLNTFVSDVDGIPSSVDFVRDEPSRVVAAYNSSHCVIFDSETAKPILRLESPVLSNSPAGKLIYKVVTHPTLPMSITAHEDRHIRFWDNNSGLLIHSMVAHLDAVTSLAVDPNGLYLLSGSHDCSIRLWNLDNKTCVQEITAHRKKFDESILDVAFHPSRPYIASAGADALAKVFV